MKYMELNHLVFRREGGYGDTEICREDSLMMGLRKSKSASTISYILKMKNEKSFYGLAAYSVAQLQEPLSGMREHLEKLRGVGPTTARLIREILDTGPSAYYEWLLLGAQQKR